MSVERLIESGRLTAAGATARDDLRLDDALGAFLDAFAQSHEDEPWRGSLTEAYAEALYEKHRLTSEGEAGTWDPTASPAVLPAIMSVLNCALLASVVDDVPDEPLYLISWATSLMERGDLEDVRTALDAAEKALAATSPEDPRLPAYLNVVAAAMFELGKRESDVRKLRKALEYGRACVVATPQGAPERAAHLSNLAAHLGALQSPDLLRESVITLQEAFEALPDGHPARADCLARMTEALFALYDHTGEARLLDEAAATGREAVALMPGNSRVLNTLSVVLRAKNTIEALEEAVHVARRAVEQPGDEPSLVLHLDSLRHCLSRYDDALGGDPGVRREIVEVARRMVALGPGDARRLSSLSWALLQQQAVDEAVDVGREAVRLSTDAEIAFRTGCALLARETEADAREAVGLLETGVGDEASAPQHRIEAARALAYAHAGLGDYVEALGAMDRAVALFPVVASWRLAQEGRVRALGRHGGLAAEAAATALDAGEPGRALTYLEQSRVLLLGEALQMRTDLRNLDDQTAEEFLRLRDLLTAETEEKPGHLPLLDSAAERLKLSTEFGDLVARIRQDDRTFLALPDVDRLLAQAAEGPIVLVSASAWRSDALILTAGGVRHVPLPKLSHDQAAMWAQRLGGQLKPDNGFLHGLLDWLWDTVAEPVLTALDPAPGSRLWWCPVGALASLPLHAAGRHQSGGPSVQSRVVSSYTATVRALGHSRTRRPEPGGALIVAVPAADGHAPLPAVVRELASVTGHLEKAGIPVGTPSQADAILSAMPTSPVIHVASHAMADPVSPWDSGIELAAARLTVGEIARLDLTGAGLAYLSACETGSTRFGLADEAVHLAGAFQVAGYPQVIGSLWAVKDRIAAKVADQVYGRILADGLDLDRVPFALHAAVESLRADFPNSPALWAAFVHHGR
ncbi:CHAT domain-containing protein [Herbidospora mongoliensis]|uniref:CHAT domain-containing protein n=1 Tax=Herbidospora mongoliensis TaxID=688067 RepID=UPI000B0EE0C0|nr:CHAT domain-containing protein [Herbidospora mongoliensis]